MYKRVNFSEEHKKLSADIRSKLEAAEALISRIPPCRNRSLAVTHLEDAMLRANLAISETADAMED